MDDLDYILSNITSMTREIKSIYKEVPSDINLDIRSPIEEIKRNLLKFQQFLAIGHLNTVSVPKYKDQIQRILNKIKFDIFAMSETNIKKNTPKSLYKFCGYKLFHKSREWGKGGGVGILIKDEYASKAKLVNVNYKNIQPEFICIELEIKKIKILVAVLYKSPSVRYGVFNDFFETMAFLSTKYENCVFLGDLNINVLDKEASDTKFLFNNIIEPLSLTQIIKSPTRITKKTSTLIDHILVNSPDKVKFSGCADFPGISDHNLVYCSYSLKKPKMHPKIVKRRDFRNFDKDSFCRELSNANWNQVGGLVEHDINAATTCFENIYSNAINKHAPLREVRVTKPVAASWLTDEIISLMDLRDRYKNKWNEIKKCNISLNLNDSSNDTYYFNRFKELKNQVNHLIRKAKIIDFNNKINNKISDGKQFHFNAKEFNIVEGKKGGSSNCHLDPGILNESFVKNNNALISDNVVNRIVRRLNRNSRRANFEFSDVTPNEVIEITKTLKSNACGIDEISAFFIKLSITSSAHIFAEIVNASLKSGLFPCRWKKARIKPIPKIPDPITASDFRPISLLITFSKILEKIVAKQMKKFLTQNKFFDTFQSAYREQHSTTTALVDITDNIYRALDNSEITILVLLYYSKAFDCANHKIILAKLRAMGFGDAALKWISSYLSNRSQQVVTDKGESTWIDLLNGVPQGSILGPLLFTILVSDISKEIKHCKYHLYADDTQLYISGKVSEVVNLIQKMNRDLDKISEFSVNNFLKLNEGKSKYIIIGSRSNIKKINDMRLPYISINNKPIEREIVVKNLGILFDQYMSWENEVSKCISNGYFKLRQAYRFKNFLSSKSKKLIVQTYILSQFNYSSIILQNLTKFQSDRIQKFQNTCARFILNLKKFDHISEGLSGLNFLKMSKLREIQSLVLMHKICKGKAPIYLIKRISYRGDHHAHFTRSRRQILIKHSKSNFGKFSFFNHISNKYNIIKNELDVETSLSVNTFKLKLKSHFAS